MVIIGKHLEYQWIKDVFYEAAIVPPVEVEEIENRAHDHSHSDDDSHDDDHDDDLDDDKKQNVKKVN